MRPTERKRPKTEERTAGSLNNGSMMVQQFKTILAITLLLAISLSMLADDVTTPGIITTAMITNFVSKLDTTAIKSDVDTYANMLAEEFTITITSDTQRGPLPKTQSKRDYVNDMRASIKDSRVMESNTTIDQITITDSGTRARVNCTLAERTRVLALDSKQFCNLRMRQKFSLELRKGELKITKLESQIAEIKWE